MKKLPIILLILFLTLPATAKEITLQVISAHDGDTFTAIEEDSNTKVKIRLYGVDCPETKQAGGT
jgi:micrococcal nuclease